MLALTEGTQCSLRFFFSERDGGGLAQFRGKQESLSDGTFGDMRIHLLNVTTMKPDQPRDPEP